MLAAAADQEGNSKTMWVLENLTISSLPMPPEDAASLDMRPTMGRALCNCLPKFFTAPPIPLQSSAVVNGMYSAVEGLEIYTNIS